MALSDSNEKAVSLDFDKGAFFNGRASFGTQTSTSDHAPKPA
jgi:hypothetical protein